MIALIDVVARKRNLEEVNCTILLMLSRSFANSLARSSEMQSDQAIKDRNDPILKFPITFVMSFQVLL